MKKWLPVTLITLIALVGVLTAVYLGAAREDTPVAPPAIPADVPGPRASEPEPGPSPAELEAIASQKQALEAELAAARRELTDLRMQAVSEPGPEAATNAAPNEPASFMETFASMMDSPDMQEMMKVQSRMALDQSHGEFFRGMGLSEEVEAELKDLLVSRNLSAMSTGMRALRGEAADGENPGEVMEAVNQEIRGLLGDDDYKLFERYEVTQVERMQVDMFKERLSSDQALDWETQDRLIEAMANARLAAPGNEAFASMNSGEVMPSPEMMEGVVDYMDTISQLYREEAATLLNEEQFTVFEESLKQYETMQRAGIKMAEAMFAAPDKPVAGE